MKSSLQQVNSRIRCYEAALTRCGVDAASLLQLNASQNPAAAQVPGASSANGSSNCGERTETEAADIVTTSAASVSVSRPTKTPESAAAAASESKSPTRPPDAAAMDPNHAAQHPASRDHTSEVEMDVHETLQQPHKDNA